MRIRDPMLLGALACLSSGERARLRESTKRATALERKWIQRFRDEIDACDARVFESLWERGQFAASDVDFLPLVLEHSFNAMAVGMRSAREDADEQQLPRRLAKPAGATRIPRTLSELRMLYDRWRKKRDLPPRQREIAASLKKAYLQRVQSVWERYGDDFRRGKEFDRDAVRAVLRRQGDMAKARADTIVQTESTLYYNKARRAIYDRSDDVTHYLFVALRDKATTKWCKSRQGLVYAKGDPLLDAETPPCFTGETPVLTIEGWKRIDSIGIGEYVWSHAKRWRRVTEVHRTDKESVDLLQIGFGVATANHPYFERNTGFVPAELFRPEEGIRAMSLNLRQVLRAALGALVQARPKVLRNSLSHHISGRYSARATASVVERWAQDAEARVRRDFDAAALAGEHAGVRTGACRRGGEDNRSSVAPGRGRPSHQRNQDGQSSGEPAGNDLLRACLAAPKTRTRATRATVYNLEVEDDHTYFAGGFLVHNCHWNCRSEVLPLSPLNPSHAKLIDDPARRRRNHQCEPLPPGWSKR